MKIFSGTSNVKLAEWVCNHLGTRLGKIDHHQFLSGEQFCQFKENIRGQDVYFIQPLSAPVNDNLMQLLVMADAARRSSAERITAVIPYFGYARQDRKTSPRVPISAKLVMDIIEAAGFHRILTMDLHAPQIGGFTNLPFDHLEFRPSLIRTLNGHDIDVIVAPDIGGVKRAEIYADELGLDLAIIAKKRHNESKVEVKHFVGDVTDKIVLIVDDLTESAGTLIEAAKSCREQGAKKILCAVTHGCFSDTGHRNVFHAIDKKVIDKFYVSNTVDIDAPHNLLHLVDVSDVFAKAILNIHRNESVSALF
jgi:ribose-phosphate pyrophosphokinase